MMGQFQWRMNLNGADMFFYGGKSCHMKMRELWDGILCESNKNMLSRLQLEK